MAVWFCFSFHHHLLFEFMAHLFVDIVIHPTTKVMQEADKVVALPMLVLKWRMVISQQVMLSINLLSYCIFMTLSIGAILTHFRPVFPFYTPWKHQNAFGFLVFSGGIKWGHWREMDQRESHQWLLFIQ